MENKKITKSYCYNCQCDTNQEMIFQDNEIVIPEIIRYSDKKERIDSIFTIEARLYKVFKCNGCDKKNIKVYQRYDPKKEDILIHSYPKKNIRKMPEWIVHLSFDYISLFSEIYESLNNGHSKLPLMGARTLLDVYIVNKIGDVGPFKKKINTLLQNNIISNSDKDLLEKALEYGHAAIHRGYEAEQNEIMQVLDIIEYIFQKEALLNYTKNLKKTIR